MRTSDYLKSVNKLYSSQKKMSDHISAISPDKTINLKSSINMVSNYKKAIKDLNLTKPLVSRLDTFLNEVKGLPQSKSKTYLKLINI